MVADGRLRNDLVPVPKLFEKNDHALQENNQRREYGFHRVRDPGPARAERQAGGDLQAGHANLFPFEVITEATQPTFTVDDSVELFPEECNRIISQYISTDRGIAEVSPDDRCADCREYDNDGCYNCGPLTIAKVFNPAEPQY